MEWKEWKENYNIVLILYYFGFLIMLTEGYLIHLINTDLFYTPQYFPISKYDLFIILGWVQMSFIFLSIEYAFFNFIKWLLKDPERAKNILFKW